MTLRDWQREVPPRSIAAQIDQAIDVDIDFWVENKQREPEQIELLEEEI